LSKIYKIFFFLFITFILSFHFIQAKNHIVLYPEKTTFLRYTYKNKITDQSRIIIENLPHGIDYQSLRILSPSIKTWQQSFDLAHKNALLNKAKGSYVDLETNKKKESLVLLGTSENNVYLRKGNHVLVNPEGTLSIPKNNLTLSPTITLMMPHQNKEKTNVTISFFLNTISSSIIYHADYNQATSSLLIHPYIHVKNNSQATLQDLAISVQVGFPNFLPSSKPIISDHLQTYALRSAPPSKTETISDYFLYQPTGFHTLDKNSELAIQLFKSVKFITNKIWRVQATNVSPFYHQKTKKIPIHTILRFKNSSSYPLAPGLLKLYSQNTFLGESLIKSTPADDICEITYGQALYMKASKTHLSSKFISRSHNMKKYQDSFAIKIKNFSKKTARFEVRDRIDSLDWQLVKHSHKYQKIAADQIKFIINVKPNETQSITYTVTNLRH
jgi:hypothetical protein